jgi:hypothetical protein
MPGEPSTADGLIALLYVTIDDNAKSINYTVLRIRMRDPVPF